MTGPNLTGVVLEGRYRIEGRLSEGAMGVVYKAVRTKLNRPVAIKVMHTALPEAMAARGRFEREAKLMALLEHPHCVSVIDYGLHDGKPYVVMELVRGRSLHDLIVEQGRFEIPRAAEIMRQVLSGLAHAHDQGIIHRDIKPANIMITPKAPLGVHARILDFGLARLCAQSTSLTDGVAVGTPSYMAPEQCRGDELDERVDIYACGVVLFELLTGTKPFIAKDPLGIIKMQLEDKPPRLADRVPGDYGALEAVVARALQKKAVDRYPSAVAMAEAIDAATGGQTAAPDRTSSFRDRDIEGSQSVPVNMESQALPLEGSSTKFYDPQPRSRKRWFVLALLALLAAGGWAAYVYWLDEAPPPAPVAKTGAPEVLPEPAAVPKPPHPYEAQAAYKAGMDYFAKLWWADGIKSFREAIAIDPSYRDDPELLKAVVKGFTYTPSYDDRLGSFLVYLGSPAAPYLEDVANSHASPEIRARASAMLKRLH